MENQRYKFTTKIIYSPLNWCNPIVVLSVYVDVIKKRIYVTTICVYITVTSSSVYCTPLLVTGLLSAPFGPVTLSASYTTFAESWSPLKNLFHSSIIGYPTEIARPLPLQLVYSTSYVASLGSLSDNFVTNFIIYNNSEHSSFHRLVSYVESIHISASNVKTGRIHTTITDNRVFAL